MIKEINYREMMEEDIPSVVEIEEEAFPIPWTKEIFEHEMNGNDYAYYVVAVEDEEVIGHCGMWIVLDECHITNVAVREHLRGNGIGEGLMREAIHSCKEMNVRLMTLEVRVSNHTAQSLIPETWISEMVEYVKTIIPTTMKMRSSCGWNYNEKRSIIF